jgi:hypothetical protein
MSKLVVAATVAAVLAFAAGCGGGASSGPPPSPSSLSAKIPGCIGYAAISPTLYAREEGGCTLNGDQLDIVTFTTSAAEDNWVKVASQFGGILVRGDRWVVGTGSQASADAVKAALGGSES